MTQLEFKVGLKKGRGFCVLALRDAKDPNRFKKLVLWACEQNLSLDAQLEGTRAEYLADLVGCYANTTPFVEKAERLIQKNLTRRDWGLQQSCELLAVLANRGDAGARAALYRIGGELFRRRIALINGEVPIQVKENVVSILSAIIPLGRSKKDQNLVIKGVRQYLSDGVFDAEFREELHDVALRHSKWLAAALVEKTTKGYGSRQGLVSLRKFERGFLELPITRQRLLALRRMRRFDEVRKLARQCMTASDFRTQVAELEAFTDHSLVGYLPRTFVEGLLESPHRKVVFAARRLMAKIQSSFSLKLGLELLQEGSSFDEALEMVARNCRKSDEPCLLTALKKVGRFSRHRRHSIHRSVICALEESRCAFRRRKVLDFLVDVVECSSCRERCVRMFDRMDCLSDSFLEECRFDAGESLRNFARERLGR